VQEEETLLEELYSTDAPTLEVPDFIPHSPNLLANSVQLPLYRGKELLLPTTEAGASSSLSRGMVDKSYAWSRGISTELSPLQTRSSRKKKDLMSSQQSDTVPSSLDSKALRALKALARSK
jgi:hypothetical protein